MATSYPFERFSDQAKNAMALAQQEAERSHHSYIGTEHLLLGMFQVEGAMAAQILAGLGLEITSVRDAIQGILGRNERILVRQIIPTSRVRKVIEIAFEEARRRAERHVGTQHLLLALMIEGEGIAGHVLNDLGVTVDRVREAITRLSAAGMHEKAAPGGSQTGGTIGSPPALGIARALDDLSAVELLAALLDRFGTTDPPPPPLLTLVAELRRVRDEKQAAVAAEDYGAAKRSYDEEQRLQADATAALDAWRHRDG